MVQLWCKWWRSSIMRAEGMLGWALDSVKGAAVVEFFKADCEADLALWLSNA